MQIYQKAFEKWMINTNKNNRWIAFSFIGTQKITSPKIKN